MTDYIRPKDKDLLQRLFEFVKPQGAYYIEDVWMLDKVDMNPS